MYIQNKIKMSERNLLTFKLFIFKIQNKVENYTTAH